MQSLVRIYLGNLIHSGMTEVLFWILVLAHLKAIELSLGPDLHLLCNYLTKEVNC